MKHLFTLITFLLSLASIRSFAQSTMMVTKTDGTQIQIRVTEIDNISFPSDDRLVMGFEYTSFWLHPEQWMQLEATCLTGDGQEVSPELTWQSTDPAVATVDNQGKVTGVADGTCQILAIAPGGQAKMDLNVVTQKMLEIEINEVGNQSCHYSVTPADPSLRYYHDYRIQSGEYSVDGMTQYGSEEQNIFHFIKDWWSFCADLYGMAWEDYMNESGLVEGNDGAYVEGLRSGSQYCVYAMAMNEDGTLALPVEVKKFTTTEPQKSDITFEVTMNSVSSSGATFTIVPSNDDPYFVNVQRASYVDWFIERDRLDDMAADLASSFSPSVYPEAYCQGKVTRSMDDFLSTIRSDNDYYVIVFGYNDGQTSPVSLTKFHTK